MRASSGSLETAADSQILSVHYGRIMFLIADFLLLAMYYCARISAKYGVNYLM